MSKTLIGILFILAGLVYGSLAIDGFYSHTLGYLVEHNWIKPPTLGKKDLPAVLGRKPTILLYAAVLIIIGVFILWKQ